MTISYEVVLLRLAVTVALCALLGLEREARDQVAGLRTHVLVGLGAALFTMAGAYGFHAGARVDPTRVAAQVVSGIGFLGAGAIVRQGFTVRGVTTAAVLWISAAIGLAVGAGYIFAAVIATGLSLIALDIFRRLRPRALSHLRGDAVLIELELAAGPDIGAVITALGARGVQVRSLRSRLAGDAETSELSVLVPPSTSLQPILAEVSRLPGVRVLSAPGIDFTSSGSSLS